MVDTGTTVLTTTSSRFSFFGAALTRASTFIRPRWIHGTLIIYGSHSDGRIDTRHHIASKISSAQQLRNQVWSSRNVTGDKHYRQQRFLCGKINNAPFNHENENNAPDNQKMKIMPQIIGK